MLQTQSSPWSILSDRFAFNRNTGEFFLLNPEGALAVQMAITGNTTEEIAAALAERFGPNPETALRDAEQFVTRLKGLDLLESKVTASARS
jgi:hypothetical protein